MAVLTLALGIGANSAIFSLVYAAVLRPLGFAQVERLAFVTAYPVQTNTFEAGASGPEFEEWKPQLRRIFEEFATISGTHGSTWSDSDEGAHLTSRDVSENFFSLLGVHPLAGRAFTAEDTQSGHGDVVMLSYRFWQEHYGGDLGALGRSMREKGSEYRSYTVVGVLPPGFEFDAATDLWKPQQPLSSFLMTVRGARRFRVLGRLKPEIRLEQAQAAMNTVAAQEAGAHPESNRGWEVRVASLRDHFRSTSHLGLWLLWAAVGCLLLIACANAANLLLARSAARASEISVRLALGSSRGRLIAQLLTESSVLAVLAGGCGWVMAAWSFRLLRFWGSYLVPAATLQDMVRTRPDALDPAVLAFTLAASAMAVLLFGLGPAWRSTRLELHHALQGSSGNRNTRKTRISQILVTVEVAIIMVLMMAAGLLVRSFAKLTSVDAGFQAVNRITFDIELPQLPESALVDLNRNPEEVRRRFQDQTLWFQELDQRLRSLPGIEDVGASNGFPLTDDAGGWVVTIDGKPLPASVAFVSPGYFSTVGAPLVAGSNFSPATDALAASKPLIVNQTLAHLLFPDGSAVGKHVDGPRCRMVSNSNTKPGDCVIVGIARDTRFSLDSAPPPAYYYSLYQDAGNRVTYAVRASHDPAGLIPRVRTVIANMPPVHSGKPYIFNLQTMDQLVATSVATPRFRSWLVSLFAGVALLLAAVGIYGVQSYAVSQRTHEIGIRMALGASPAGLFAGILGEAAGWTLIGIGVGVSAGAAATRLIAGFLFGVSRWDPVTLVVAPVVLFGVALLASYVPARRAMRIDPTAALRA